MHLIDFIIFIVFTLGVVLFGCSFFKKGSSADEFTSAGHSIPGWVVGMSIAAKYFVPFYRHSGSVSAYTFLEEKFGAWARLYASACYLLTQIARMGSILYLLAVPMYILMGWNMHKVIILTSTGIIIYSMMGGLKAVIWADAIQGIILIGGAVLCLAILMFSMPEGIMQTFDLAVNSPEGNKFSLGAFTSDLTTSTFWVCLIYGVFFLIGSALYSYYSAGMAQLPDEIAAKPDYVFPYFIVNGLPVGLRGLLIASIFAAGMSTVSTSVTSAATIILTDYVRPFFLRARKLELAIVRLSSFGVGILGACVAIAMLSVESIIDAWWTLSSIFSGGMLGLFLLGCMNTWPLYWVPVLYSWLAFCQHGSIKLLRNSYLAAYLIGSIRIRKV